LPWEIPPSEIYDLRQYIDRFEPTPQVCNLSKTQYANTTNVENGWAIDVSSAPSDRWATLPLNPASPSRRSDAATFPPASGGDLACGD
jgi:hypothetical protein